MQVRGAYASLAVHALNGIVGAVDNVGGTLKSNKEYTTKFPKPDDFMDEIAKKGKKHGKIDHRGRLEFPSLNKKPGGGVVTNNAADGILNEDPNEIKVAIFLCFLPALAISSIKSSGFGNLLVYSLLLCRVPPTLFDDPRIPFRACTAMAA